MLMGVISNDVHMQFTPDDRDIMNILEYVSRFVSCIAFGLASDIFGRWKVTAYSSILCLLFGIMTIISPNTKFFLSFRFLQSLLT